MDPKGPKFKKVCSTFAASNQKRLLMEKQNELTKTTTELTEEEKRDREILQYYAEGGHYYGD